MKIVVAPDSFKGSLSAPDAARCIAEGFRRVFPDAEMVFLPVADGGEGTLDALVTATGGRTITQTVTGPLGTPVQARWGVCGDGTTAVVELAQAAGLTLVPLDRRDPKITTTRGVGELLLAALKLPGVRQVVVGLGGSATNDGGAGLLSALGVRFLDADGRELPPGGAALSRLACVDLSGINVDASRAVLIACDVDNPLTGLRGASAVFGPQKGATPDDVAALDAALTRYGDVLREHLPLQRKQRGYPWPQISGAGAAGGTAAGLLWLFPNAVLRPGIDLVLDAVGFDGHFDGAELIITGEGRLDGQTFGGKVVAGVARRAQAKSVPVVALVGEIGSDVSGEALAQVGIDAALPIVPGPVALDDALTNAARYLTDASERAARLLCMGGLR